MNSSTKANLMAEANRLLDGVEATFNRIFSNVESRINAALREGKCFYDGTLRLKEDGTPLLREDAPRDVYEDLEPYCYAKVNSLLNEGRIRIRDGKLIIRNK